MSRLPGNDIPLTRLCSTAIAKGVLPGTRGGGRGLSAPWGRLSGDELHNFISPDHYPRNLLGPLIDTNQMRVGPATAIVNFWRDRQNNPNASPFEFHHVLMNGKMEPRSPRVVLQPSSPPSAPAEAASSKPKALEQAASHDKATTSGQGSIPARPTRSKARRAKSKAQTAIRDLDSDEEDKGSGDELPTVPELEKTVGVQGEGTKVVSDADNKMDTDEKDAHHPPPPPPPPPSSTPARNHAHPPPPPPLTADKEPCPSPLHLATPTSGLAIATSKMGLQSPSTVDSLQPPGDPSWLNDMIAKAVEARLKAMSSGTPTRSMPSSEVPTLQSDIAMSPTPALPLPSTSVGMDRPPQRYLPSTAPHRADAPEHTPDPVSLETESGADGSPPPGNNPNNANDPTGTILRGTTRGGRGKRGRGRAKSRKAPVAARPEGSGVEEVLASTSSEASPDPAIILGRRQRKAPVRLNL